jgi:hypothetical protein
VRVVRGKPLDRRALELCGSQSPAALGANRPILDHPENLHPNCDHRQKQRDRSERQCLFRKCANHDIPLRAYEHRANIVLFMFYSQGKALG